MRPSKLPTAFIRHNSSASRYTQTRRFGSTPWLLGSAEPTAAEVAELSSARSYCAELLRKYDNPSHVLAPFVPHKARDAYLAIRALNVNVARIADTTSTPTMGMMSMQFWRDTVTKSLAGTPPKEPVAIVLAQAASALNDHSGGKAKLSKNWLHRIINTREQYLGNPPYATLSALESYAENTYSTMLYLTLSALPQASITTDHIASHIGKAMGIAAVLRGLPFVAFPQLQPISTGGSITGQSGQTQGAIMLPLDVMAKANVKEEDVFLQGAAAPGLREAVFTVATRANDHLITAREMISKLRSEGSVGHEFEHQNDPEHQYSHQQLNKRPGTQMTEVKQAFGVFLHSVSTQSWLDRLEKVDFDIFDPALRKADWNLAWKAYWAFRKKKL